MKLELKSKLFPVFVLTLFFNLFYSRFSHANDYVIFSIAQDIPMGEEGEKLKKNFYVNLGASQGVTVGSVLNVHRSLSRIDSFDNNKRYTFKMKIGELEVIHTEENSAVAHLKLLRNDEKSPLFDLENFIIGDHVDIKLK
jgi:hypothetical protein